MTFAPVQALTKELAVLAAVNRRGLVTVRELHADTGIPKPTIVRMLQTLIAAGYVRQDENVRGYVVTSAIHQLSSGFHGAPMVIEAARPLADKLTREIVWPCAICTLELDSVVIDYSTSPESLVAPFHASLGMRLSLGGRALGRAYLCFRPPKERAHPRRGDRAICHADEGDRRGYSGVVIAPRPLAGLPRITRSRRQDALCR